MKKDVIFAIFAIIICALPISYSSEAFEDATLSTIPVPATMSSAFHQIRAHMLKTIYDPRLSYKVSAKEAQRHFGSANMQQTAANKVTLNGLQTYENVYVYDTEGELIKVCNSDINGIASVRLDNFPDRQFVIKTSTASFTYNKA